MIRSAGLAAVAALVLAVTVGSVGGPAAAQAPPASGGPVSAALLEDLAAAYRVLEMEGVIDAYGHVSMRHPNNPNRYLMSRSLGPALVTPDDIMEYDIDSTPIDPKGRTSVLERFIHGEIYRARPDVMVVVHSHAPSVIPFSVTKVPLRPVFHMATFLGVGGAVPVWDSRSVKDPMAPMLLVRTPLMGASLAKALGNHPVMLMRGHGNVVVGASIPMVVRQAIYTEVNAKLLLSALQLGGPITYISPEETEAVGQTAGDVQRGWNLWKQRALGK